MRRLGAILAHVLKKERAPARAEVSIALVGDAAIRRLNRRFLHRDRPTDVLAFPLESPGRARGWPGEVIVSVDRARVQAKQAGHPLRTEVALLAVHGVLHLAGYDDRTRAEAERMMRRARVLLADVGERVRG